jgi:hypothetical protein
VLSYRYGGKLFRFLVNGQTGRIAGQKPLSAGRIAGFVAAIIGLILLVFLILALIGALAGSR